MKHTHYTNPRIQLNKLIKESLASVIRDINQEAIPNTISLLQENFINNISDNEYFNLEEKQAISLYFKYNKDINEENIAKFNSGLLNEGLKDIFLKAIAKVKNIFGGIKNFVVKIWSSIKKFVIEWGRKAYNAIKGKVTQLKPKIESFLKNAKDKAALVKEFSHITDVYEWLKTKVTSFLDNYTEKITGVADNTLKENIFNKDFTFVLTEAETLEIPTDITNPETIKKWEKLNIPWKTLFKAITFVFNPIKALALQLVKFASNKMFDGISQLVSKLGGPSAIDYVILPAIVSEIAELSGLFHGADELLKEALGLIPGVGPFIEVILHVGHYLFVALAVYEILHEVGVGLGLAKGH
jgi:hypothetical protein